MTGTEFDLDGVAQNAEIDIPDDPGPAIADRTPVLGSVRRSQGMPVIRDELARELNL